MSKQSTSLIKVLIQVLFKATKRNSFHYLSHLVNMLEQKSSLLRFLIVSKLEQVKYMKVEVTRVGLEYATSYFLKEMSKCPVWRYSGTFVK